jgi:hypothetical protein
VNLALLAGLDLMLVKLDLLSPPFTYGLEGVGFGYAGVRRSSDFGVVTPGAGEAVTIAMVGDSHSQLAFDGRPLESHEFVLERRLRAAGIPALMISAGRGRYSPLQEYLLFKLAIEEPYHPRLLVMNVYSGNDFYDMLRPDDRPHYLRDSAGGIAIEDPEWITFVNPSTRRWIERSRLLWAVDELSSRLGYPRVVTRLRMLGAAARQPGHTTAETVRYLSDLRASQEPRLGYPAALAAQILNQALFFKHFPEAVDESLVFMRSSFARRLTGSAWTCRRRRRRRKASCQWTGGRRRTNNQPGPLDGGRPRPAREPQDDRPSRADAPRQPPTI